MNISETLFALIRNELLGEQLSSDVISSLDGKMLEDLYSLSRFHDCAHLLYNPIVKSGVFSTDDSTIKKFQKKQMLALYQVSQIEFETERICELLNAEQIPYILLKGAKIRKYYPEPWMRTSCDIDILVHKEDTQKALSAITQKLHYSQKGEPDFHDVSLYSENGIQLELHFSILENSPVLDVLLDKVWDYAVKKEDSFEYELTGEYFVFYFLSHMAYHFMSGGCGIRPFIDLWYIKKNIDFDSSKLYSLLEQCSLKDFYENALYLSDVWMECKPYNETTERMENFVFNGGSYGTRENLISLRSSKKKNKLSYVFSRLFPSYSVLKIRYPSLDGKHYLICFYWVKRFFDNLLNKKENAVYELKTTINIDEEKNSEMIDLMKTLNLK